MDGSGVFFISRQIVYLKTKRRTGKRKQKRAAAGRRVSAGDTKVPLVVRPKMFKSPSAAAEGLFRLYLFTCRSARYRRCRK